MGNESHRDTETIPLYRATASRIESMIAEGIYRAGDRLPSIRVLSRQLRVSINTIAQAYAFLEDTRIIEARPQSGHYVSCVRQKRKPLPAASPPEVAASRVSVPNDHLRIIRELADPGIIPLGRGAPSSALLPVAKLNRMLANQTRSCPLDCVSYASSDGLERLRIEIAKRSGDYGCRLSPDDIIITSGCMEAVTLALYAVCRPGDTVLVESPVYYTFLNIIQWLDLKVLEIPASPEEGMNLEVLRYALEHNEIRACLIISNYGNPLGSLMADAKKQELVRLLATRGIPLIEDDVYGDLGFGHLRPYSFKAYDTTGDVILCSSFSKTLAPGYRTGWIVPGNFYTKVASLKSMFNIATATPPQLAIAEFLSCGGYDRHLRATRRTCQRQLERIRQCVMESFPDGVRNIRPQGGYFLWLELPEPIDTVRLYQEALCHGIGIAPGMLFTTGNKFKNCLRLNGSFWSERIAEAIRTIGRIASEIAC